MKSTFSTLLLFSSVTVFSQQTTSNTDYLKKSKHQKTAAWILAGGGLLCTAIGSVQFKNDDGSVGNSRNTVFLVTGLTAIGISIPLFIASSKNKKKASSVSINNEKIQTLQKGSFANKLVPAVRLTIRL